MRTILRLSLWGLGLGSLLFAGIQLKKLAEVAEGLKSGSPTALASLSGMAGVPSQAPAAAGLLERGLGEAGAVQPPAAGPASAPSGSLLIADTNSLGGRGSARPARSGAVLIDQATGKRYELPASRPKASVPVGRWSLPAAPSLPSAAPGDLKGQKRLAYGLLLGTVALAIALVILARRFLRGN